MKFSGYAPVTFLLKCQCLKDFRGASTKGTFMAMLDGLESYFSSDELVKKSHTCEEGGAHLTISFWHLLMNLKNK